MFCPAQFTPITLELFLKVPRKRKITFMSGTQPDDLAAVRTIVNTLNEFSTDEQH
jgi:hypothetical protein